MSKVTAVNIIILDYAFLLVAFLVAAYNALKSHGNNRNDKEERI